MKRPMIFAFGLSLAVIGLVKALSHTAGSDFAAALAASWCRPGAVDASGGLWATVQAHCWGCGVAPLGLAIMLWAAMPALLVAWRAVAGRNAPVALVRG